MDHFAFTALAFDAQIRFCQHLAQALETATERVGGHLEEKVGGAFARAGVDLAAQGLHVAHQAVFQREARGTEEEQVFEEVRQTGPFGRRVVAARVHPQCGGRALEARGVAQGQLQAVGEGELADGVRHGGSGGCAPC
ncbi:hypothetical protein D3C80_916670 [compost metagenome]